MPEPKETCDLCGLDIEGRPYWLNVAPAPLKFCCDGCRGVYKLLNDVEEIREHGSRPQEKGA